MADEKKPYRVVQEGRDGVPIEIEGGLYNINNTVWLTPLEAKYRIGLSIEPAFPADQPTPVGEHRESGIDVDESSRPFKEVVAAEDEVRSSRRGTRSTPSRPGED